MLHEDGFATASLLGLSDHGSLGADEALEACIIAELKAAPKKMSLEHLKLILQAICIESGIMRSFKEQLLPPTHKAEYHEHGRCRGDFVSIEAMLGKALLAKGPLGRGKGLTTLRSISGLRCIELRPNIAKQLLRMRKKALIWQKLM